MCLRMAGWMNLPPTLVYPDLSSTGWPAGSSSPGPAVPPLVGEGPLTTRMVATAERASAIAQPTILPVPDLLQPEPIQFILAYIKALHKRPWEALHRPLPYR